MAEDVEETDSRRQLRAINDAVLESSRAEMQCVHGGDDEATHNDVDAWCLHQAKAMEAAGGFVGADIPRLQAEAGEKFPGCARATPLRVMLHHILLALTPQDTPTQA